MKTHAWRVGAAAPLLLLGLAQAGIAAAETPAAPGGDAAVAAERLDPAAVAALESMGSALRELKSFSVHSTSSIDIVLETGQKIQLEQDIGYRVRRPDGLYVELESDRKDRRIYYDGTSLTIYSPRLNYYASVETRARSLGELVANAETEYGIALPLADLFYWGTPDLPVAALTSAIHVGPAVLGGTRTEQYAFRQPGIDWQLWIASDSRLPEKIVITSLDDPARPEFRAQLDWDTRSPVPASVFRFDPPKDAASIVMTLPAASDSQN